MPCFSVTWPTRPAGVYSQYVHAVDATDAVRAAADLDWPTAEGYTVAFDYVPEVWRLRRPYRWLSRHVAGPHYPDNVPFVPAPAT